MNSQQTELPELINKQRMNQAYKEANEAIYEAYFNCGLPVTNVVKNNKGEVCILIEEAPVKRVLK